MMPMNAGDPQLYGEFTALKRNGLQTWIAVGGVSVNILLSVARLMHTSGRSMIRVPLHTTRTATWFQPRQTAVLSFNH